MLKAEAEELLRLVSWRIGHMLRELRRTDASECLACGKSRGQQHSFNCPCWPLILWRQKYNDALQREIAT